MSTEEKKKGPGGRPAFEPTDEQRKLVTQLAGFGIIQPIISKIVGIDPQTLRKYFRHELDTAMDKLVANVAGNLYRQATKDDFRAVEAAKFFLKTRGGWRETSVVENVGAQGGPIQTVQMSADKFAEIAKKVADEI